MNKSVSIATCPACRQSIPLDINGQWVTHRAPITEVYYDCVGSGETPALGNVSTVIVSDE